jgi:death on curing protein
VDGNKRTAYVLMRLTLMKDQKDIDATEDEKYNFVISAARGELQSDDIKAWLKSKMK